MTIQELYAEIGGNYEQAVKIMRKDRMIAKYIRKLKDSHLDEALASARRTMDADALFESAHAMKGVCANLGLDELAGQANLITEEFRQGNDRHMSDEEAAVILDHINDLYQHVLAGIQRYEEEA